MFVFFLFSVSRGRDVSTFIFSSCFLFVLKVRKKHGWCSVVLGNLKLGSPNLEPSSLHQKQLDAFPSFIWCLWTRGFVFSVNIPQERSCLCVCMYLKNEDVLGFYFFILSFLVPRFACAKQGKGRNRGIVGTVAEATTEGQLEVTAYRCPPCANQTCYFTSFEASQGWR